MVCRARLLDTFRDVTNWVRHGPPALPVERLCSDSPVPEMFADLVCHEAKVTLLRNPMFYLSGLPVCVLVRNPEIATKSTAKGHLPWRGRKSYLFISLRTGSIPLITSFHSESVTDMLPRHRVSCIHDRSMFGGSFEAKWESH